MNREKNKLSSRFFKLLPALLLIVLLCGCLSRVLEIKSTPPGARVFVEGEEIGRTPVTYEFDHYGPRDILLIKGVEGNETVSYESTSVRYDLTAPWWASFPVDFFVEIIPYEIVDKHEYSPVLVKASEKSSNVNRMLLDMNKMKSAMLKDE